VREWAVAYRHTSTDLVLDGSTGRSVETPQPILRAENLRKTFYSGSQPITPVDGIDFEIERGEMIAIVGPSGAGKSTLLHLVAALDTPTSGEVYFAGNSLASLAEAELAKYRNRSVGFVWQRHHLLPDFTAAENVAMPLLMEGKAPGEALRTAEGWLGQVGLAGLASQNAGVLSGGEQQRVAIARALVNQPVMLLADEPTGDLDERSAEEIFELFEQLHRSHHLTSILATHNLALARRADRVLSLQRGKLTPGMEAPARAAAGAARPARAESNILEDRR
jgi:lipoprotein-releasing system ATP-binding protein